MKINHIVSAGTFPFDVMFSFGETDDELREALKVRGINLKKKNLIWKHSWRGLNTRLKDGSQIVRMRKVPSTSEDFGILVHEIFHASHFIINRIGIRLTDSSEEVYAYLMEHFYKEIVNKIVEEESKITWDGKVYEG